MLDSCHLYRRRNRGTYPDDKSKTFPFLNGYYKRRRKVTKKSPCLRPNDSATPPPSTQDLSVSFQGPLSLLFAPAQKSEKEKKSHTHGKTQGNIFKT